MHDRAFLAPMLERIPLTLKSVLIEAHQPIQHVVFPESGIVSTVADTAVGRIEVGLVGREGMVGLPVALGTDRTPHTHLVQGAGEALRIDARELRKALSERPSIFLPIGLYAHTLLVQTAQTAYANVAFSMQARLARWILMTQDRTDGDSLILTHGFLATMLGVQRTGVTVATHVLEAIGAIKNHRGRIVVLDRGKLLELAGDAYQVAEDEYQRLMPE